MSTGFQVLVMESVLKEMTSGLKNKGRDREFLSENDFMKLKMAWADFAIALVEASGTMDEEHRAKNKEDRYQFAMKLLR